MQSRLNRPKRMFQITVVPYDGRAKLGDFLQSGLGYDRRRDFFVRSCLGVPMTTPRALTVEDRLLDKYLDSETTSGDNMVSPSASSSENSSVSTSLSIFPLDYSESPPADMAPLDCIGMEHKGDNSRLPIMVFESPSTSSDLTSFKNGSRYLVHDYPPAPPQYWSVMRPVRYAV
eukprot:CAMPEP_0182484472 /NCGR_PEP_ID=MMETSP1319-20130603/43497_1 /TAXON_ID=172717 /ORGANISM="Bolidomonas pacifica, Strain RCC208" /LENGTH=173 /DNA_ID=CAMNT_0024686379 /DNA_START=98 /DNA_END=615 /DNA_ORIENTATION=+